MFRVESHGDVTHIRMARSLAGRPVHEVSAYRIGDLYVHPRVRYLRRIEDVGEHLESLRRVLALEPEVLICSHAGLVADARGALAAKIAWWEGLAAEARALRERGWTVRRITRRLLGREGFLAYASFGDFSKKNLVRSLLSGP